jgi:hypothetical protein
MNNELGRIWKEAVVILFKALSGIFLEEIRKIIKKTQSG